ncbi:MAG: alanine dehydrogenase [Bacteroides sp. SM23_62_1]|nr:MAG: alanine dehydrogenase [Bacteroides sp. SM23_62_1]
MKIGILRETKTPPDRRVPFTPGQISQLKKCYGTMDIVLQPSEIRCYSDKEYYEAGLMLRDNLSECDILMGIKEVELDTLIPGKTYLFFSHTAKKQPHNRKLLQEIAARKITLIDYEYLINQNNIRLVAFGRWAGIVGAYNGLRAYGERYRIYKLKPAYQCFDYEEVKKELHKVRLPSIKILITGGGRVAGGAMELLKPLNIREVNPEEFLKKDFGEPVICRIDPWYYVRRKDGHPFDLQHFFEHPDMYESIFKPYTKVTDFYIACHYWDPRSPGFMTPTDMREPDFRIMIIADISCDIHGPIPSTIRASSIEQPFYGYFPWTEKETTPFDLRSITVMAVDNLPGELPRDASEDFGKMLADKVIPALAGNDEEEVIGRATIIRNGELTERFRYLQGFLDGKE